MIFDALSYDHAAMMLKHTAHRLDLVFRDGAGRAFPPPARKQSRTAATLTRQTAQQKPIVLSGCCAKYNYTYQGARGMDMSFRFAPGAFAGSFADVPFQTDHSRLDEVLASTTWIKKH